MRPASIAPVAAVSARNVAVRAMSADQSEPPRVRRGGNAERHWEYDEASRVYTIVWVKTYYGTWFDRQRGRTRPVFWECERLYDTNAQVTETWTWRYTDGRED